MAKINNDQISVELKVKTDEANAAIHKLKESTKALREENAFYYKEKTRLAELEGDHSAEIKRLNEQIEANRKKIRENEREVKKWEHSIDLSCKSASQLKKDIKDLQRQLDNTSKAADPKKYAELQAQLARTRQAYRDLTQENKGWLASLKASFNPIGALKGFFLGLGAVIATVIIGQFKKLTDVIMNFEKANSKLASVLGTTIEGVSRLTEQAKLLGRTTTATASQVTELQTELAKLGFTQEQIEKLTPATLKFAKTMGTDLGSAAAFAGATLRMFGKDASEAESLLATFAVSTSRSALDFQKLQASMSTVGPVANAFGLSVEETTALLGSLANAGFDASSAATATRNIILNLCDSSGALAQALGGPVKTLDDMVAGLNKLNAEGVDLNTVLELTDKRSVSAFSAFLKAGDDIAVLRDEITDCTGAFTSMNKTMGDNAAGSWAGFESAVEGLILKFFDLRGALKTLFEYATEFVNWVGEIIDALEPVGIIIANIGQILGSIVSSLGLAVGWFTKLFTSTKLGRSALYGLIAGLVAVKAGIIVNIAVTKSYTTTILDNVKAAAKWLVSLGKRAVAFAVDSAAAIKAAIAQRTWNAELLANPIIAVVALITMAVTAILSYNSAITDSTKEMDEWSKTSKEAAKQYGEQKSKIDLLVMTAQNEEMSLNRRKKALAELNRIIPEYNGHIDATTGKLVAEKEALDNYLQSLEKEMRYKANADKMAELLGEAEAARDAYQELKMQGGPNFEERWYGRVRTDRGKELGRLEKEWQEKEQKYKDFSSRLQKAIKEGTVVPPTSSGEITIQDELTNTEKAGAKLVTRLKEIDVELKKLRKEDPKTDDEYKRIQARIEALQEEKKLLEGKVKHTPGVYSEDSLAQVTAGVDHEHQKRLLEINKEDLSETEKVIRKNQEMIRYAEESVKALQELKARTNSTHTATLDKIQKEIDKQEAAALTAQDEINKAKVKNDEQMHSERLKSSEAYYKHLSELAKVESMHDHDLEKANGVFILELNRQQHQEQLDELNSYYDKVAQADYYGAEEKKKLLRKISSEIDKMRTQLLTDAGKASEMLREAMTSTSGAEAIKADYEHQTAAMKAYYAALMGLEGVTDEQRAELRKELNRRLENLDYEYLEEQYKLQEAVGLSWCDEYDRELAHLENMHKNGLLSERQYQQARLQLQMQNAQKYYDYFSNLSSTMFTAIQDAEIAASEAKFDILIQQAKNNGEETSELEEQKENEKLAIQKKYADVNFAIKVSQIVADTAVSIMTAFAQLGPIGGAIAAAMLTATGAAQAVIAKAERDKIKNMEPGRTASSTSTSKTAERVLTGYSEGGYTGDGDRYEVAGVVHKGEYVVPKPIMSNPKVLDAVGMIESIRRVKLYGAPAQTTVPGYSDGGFTGAVFDTSALAEAARAMKAVTSSLKNLKAYVVLRDLEATQENLNRARNKFTRNI